MKPPGSVTLWLAQLRAGEAAAARPLWDLYFRRLVGLAQRRLAGEPRAAADEEDIALSAFASFCTGVGEQRFPQLAGRDDLWQVLVMLTARKAARLVQRERRQKRGGGAVRHASALEDELAQVLGEEPTPDFAASMAEECRHRFAQLDDSELQAVALAKLEGYSNAEIAARLGVVERTVERRLGVIRKLWDESEAEP